MSRQNSVDQRRRFLTPSPVSSARTSSPSSHSSQIERQSSVPVAIPFPNHANLSSNDPFHLSSPFRSTFATQSSASRSENSSSSQSGRFDVSPTLSYRNQANSDFRPHPKRNHPHSPNSDGSGPFQSSGSSGGNESPSPTPRRAGAHQDRAEHFRNVQDGAPRDLRDDSIEIMGNNVYVNGLDAKTTDQDLLHLGRGFGNVLSHKAIICEHTGECKGFGFLLYSNRLEARNAINGLVDKGLFAKEAKESYRARFRRLSDRSCSNVYISNLPINFTVQDLERMCHPSRSISSRIIMDSHGVSKGVGFMRFGMREEAQRVISSLHLKSVDGLSAPLQARFADSVAQKRLRGSSRSASSDQGQNSQIDTSREESSRRSSHPSGTTKSGTTFGFQAGGSAGSASSHDSRSSSNQGIDPGRFSFSDPERRPVSFTSAFQPKDSNFSPSQSSLGQPPGFDSSPYYYTNETSASRGGSDIARSHYPTSEIENFHYGAAGASSLFSFQKPLGRAGGEIDGMSSKYFGRRNSGSHGTDHASISPNDHGSQIWAHSVLGLTPFPNQNHQISGEVESDGERHDEFRETEDQDNQHHPSRHQNSRHAMKMDEQIQYGQPKPGPKSTEIPIRDPEIISSLASLDIGSKSDSRFTSVSRSSSRRATSTSTANILSEAKNSSGQDKKQEADFDFSYGIVSTVIRQSSSSNHTAGFGLDEKTSASSPILSPVYEGFGSKSNSSPPLNSFQFDPDQKVEKKLGVKRS